MIQRMLVVWSLVPLAFSKSSLYISSNSQFIYYWILAWRILIMTLLACEMSAIVQFEHSLALPFFGIEMKTLFQWELDHKVSWVLKNWCFWTVVLLLKNPWKARRSNQSILKEITPEYSLEGLMLKLKLQYFGHLMQRANSLEKTLMLGKTEGRRRRGWQRMRWLDGITNLMDMSLSKL